MRTLLVSLIASACALTGLAWPQASRAQSLPLVFQTTFNCPEWSQSNGLTDASVCNSGDGISGNGGWTTSGGSLDQITAAANYSGGGGGRGFRHWVGDGLNNTGGGIRVSWVGVPEIWFRYYIRFQSSRRQRQTPLPGDLSAMAGPFYRQWKHPCPRSPRQDEYNGVVI